MGCNSAPGCPSRDGPQLRGRVWMNVQQRSLLLPLCYANRPRPWYTPVCFTSVFCKAHCQFTSLLNLGLLIFGLTPSGWVFNGNIAFLKGSQASPACYHKRSNKMGTSVGHRWNGTNIGKSKYWEEWYISPLYVSNCNSHLVENTVHVHWRDHLLNIVQGNNSLLSRRSHEAHKCTEWIKYIT